MSDTLDTERGICTLCGKETNGYSAYPGEWPLIFPDKWEIHENKHMGSAIPVHHHVQCVIDKLDQLAAAQKKYNDALIHATKAEQYFSGKLDTAQKEIAQLKEDNTRAYSSLALAAEDEAGYKQVEMELRDEIANMSGRLPDGMKECTILFKECNKGHGWLTATNWVQHNCQRCEFEAGRREIEELKAGYGPQAPCISCDDAKKEIEELKSVIAGVSSYLEGDPTFTRADEVLDKVEKIATEYYSGLHNFS